MKAKQKLKYYSFFLAVLLCSIIISCRPARHLEKGKEQLLNKVEINLVDETKSIEVENLENLLQQKPNRRIAKLFRFHLWMWNLTHKKVFSKNTSAGVKRKLNDIIGEEPVVYDSLYTKKSIDQMDLYLTSKGFYHSIINSEAKNLIFSKKKVKITYNVMVNQAKKITKVEYDLKQDDFEKLLNNQANNLLNKNFDLDLLKQEQDQIYKTLKANGFYHFNKQYIKIIADTLNKKDSVELLIKLLPVKLNDSSYVDHKKYRLKDIQLFNSNDDITFIDSLGISFENLNDYPVDLKLIKRNIPLQRGSFYNYKQIEKTYKQLSNLGVFSFVNIDFIEENEELIVRIKVSYAPKHSLSIEAKGTNTSGNLGLSASLQYGNKNTFGSAEKLNISMDGGSEVQANSFIFDSLASTLNTIEFGPEMSLSFPSLFLPKSLKNKYSQVRSSSTSFRLAYNYQERVEYTRHLSVFDYAYKFKFKENTEHEYALLELSTSKFDEESPIIIFADTTNNDYYQNSFRSYLNLGNHYSFTLNSTNSYFKTDIQFAGNLLSLFNQTSLMRLNDENHYELFGISYSHYIRTFFDYRHYKKIKTTQLAFRSELGFAIPLKNNEALPFDKSFFSGGSNSLRAFRNRTVGPGTYYQDPDSLLTQIGDIKLELNLEYRFKFNKWIEGAIFVDAGNIWLFNEDETNKPGAQFKLNSFYKQLSTGLGTGLRMDLSFFLFRLDWALPIYTPVVLPNYALSYFNNSLNSRLRRSQFSIGIGYPF